MADERALRDVNRRTTLLAENFAGEIERVQSHYGHIDDDAYASAVARGEVLGAEPISSFGSIDTGGIVTNQLIWPLSGSGLAIPSSSGVQMTIVSSSAEDGAGTQTGINSIYIHYLDVNLDAQVEVKVLNGTSAVTTVATDIRFIQCVHIATTGLSKAAVGNISITNGDVTYSYIAAGDRRCESSARMVPAGKRLMIKSMYAGSVSGASKTAIINLVTTTIQGYDFTSSAITFPQAGIALQDSATALPLDQPIPVSAGAVVGFEVTTSGAATVNAGFVGYLEDV